MGERGTASFGISRGVLYYLFFSFLFFFSLDSVQLGMYRVSQGSSMPCLVVSGAAREKRDRAGRQDA